MTQLSRHEQVAADAPPSPQIRHPDTSKMIEMQLTYDVLATVGVRTDLLETIKDTFPFLGELSRAGKIVQARFIARRE